MPIDQDTTLRDRIILLLNTIHAHDKKALQNIIDHRVAISATVVGDDRLPIVVGGGGDNPTLGPLGIIQGILAIEDPDAAPIAAHYADVDSAEYGLGALMGFS